MGIMDFLSDALKAAADSVKDGDVSGLMNGGFIGNKLMQDQQRIAQEVMSRKKPGKLCWKECTVNDMRCEGCLAAQQEILNSLADLERFEESIKNARNNVSSAAQTPVKCLCCGAPVENDARFCPYCGNQYPSRVLTGNLPQTDFERDKMFLEKSAAVFALYTDLYKNNIENRLNCDGTPAFAKKMISMSRSLMIKNMTMTPEQIRQGAQSNSVSYAGYISGVMSGAYKTVPQEQMEKQQEQLRQKSEELTRQTREMNQRMLDEQRARQRRTQEETAQREMRMAIMRTPRYVGGSSSSCCGNCIYYMPHDNKCAYNEFRYPDGAGDYCNDHRSR